jgi:hypothetical protein
MTVSLFTRFSWIGTGLCLSGLPNRTSPGSLCTTLRRDRLSYFPQEKRLQVRLRTGPLQADNRVSGLARNEIALSVGAGYFELAGLAPVKPRQRRRS